MTETLANGYSYDSTQRGLSNEYQHDMVQINANYFYDIVPRTKSGLRITRFKFSTIASRVIDIKKALSKGEINGNISDSRG